MPHPAGALKMPTWIPQGARQDALMARGGWVPSWGLGPPDPVLGGPTGVQRWQGWRAWVPVTALALPPALPGSCPQGWGSSEHPVSPVSSKKVHEAQAGRWVREAGG